MLVCCCSPTHGRLPLLFMSRVRSASVYAPALSVWLDRTTPVWLSSPAGGARSATVLFQAATAVRHTGGGALGFITLSRPSFSPLPAAATRTSCSAQAGYSKVPETSGGRRGSGSRTGNGGPAAETTGLMAASSTAGDAKTEEQEQEEEPFVLPRAPLPEIIVSNVPGSWAYDTMVCVAARTTTYDTALRNETEMNTSRATTWNIRTRGVLNRECAFHNIQCLQESAANANTPV